MRNRSVLSRIILSGMCSLALTVSVSAENGPQAKADTSGSKESSNSRGDIPVLTRHADGTPNAKLSLLRASLFREQSGKIVQDERSDRIRAMGDTWRLDVFGDGSGAEFLDQAATARAHNSGVDPSKAMSKQALETAGRAYIDRTLSKVIVLHPGEGLVPVATSFRTEGGVSKDGGMSYSAVVANRIIFSREINGIPVVGAGSKVTITFLNDGSVESFRYDWPNYVRTGRVQHLAGTREILRRVQRVASIRTNRDVVGEITVLPNIEAMTQPISLGDTVQLHDLKCGYYDPGLLNRDPQAPVQAGCYYHVDHRQGADPYVTTAAYSGAVPSATLPERDSHWPEAAVLRGTKMKGRPPAASGGSGAKIQPVSPRAKGPQVPEKK